MDQMIKSFLNPPWMSGRENIKCRHLNLKGYKLTGNSESSTHGSTLIWNWVAVEQKTIIKSVKGLSLVGLHN